MSLCLLHAKPHLQPHSAMPVRSFLLCFRSASPQSGAWPSAVFRGQPPWRLSGFPHAQENAHEDPIRQLRTFAQTADCAPRATPLPRKRAQPLQVAAGTENSVKFGPINICPASGNAYSPPIVSSSIGSNQFQQPALLVKINGPLNRNSSMHFDAAGRLLRNIDGLGLQTNYNYVTAGQSGMQLPSGERQCAQYDAGGKLVTQTDLAAPGLPGGPLVTSLQYDAKEEPVNASQTDAGTLISSRSFLRDSWERIIGIGDEVDSSHTRWTCFRYTDVMQQIEPLDPIRPLDRATASPSPSNNGNQPGQPMSAVIPNRFPPCLYGGSTGSSIDVKAVFPSLIIRPDGTEIALTDMKPTGPGEIVVDATGTAPVDRYFGYDFYGRLNKVGTQDFTTKQNVAGSEVRWDTDLDGLLQAIHVPDASNPSNTLDTTYTYDNSRNPQSIVSPLLTQTITTERLLQRDERRIDSSEW